jgi:hypothetical protein
MTGIDLIVLAPWIVFIAGLTVICVLLLRSRRESGSRRASGSPRAPGSRRESGPPRESGSRRTSGSRHQRPRRSAPGVPKDREPASRPDPQETRCRENNAEARPQ